MSASALLAGGILAHHLAGSTIPAASHIFGFLILILALTLLLLDENLSEEKLFIAIFIAQNGSHFLMGGKSESATLMFLSHLLAGISSYLVITRGSEILHSLESALRAIATRLIPLLYPSLFIPSSSRGSIASPHQISFRQRLRFSALSLRAPPTP